MTTVLITLRQARGRTRYEAQVDGCVFSGLYATIVMMRLYDAGYTRWQMEGV